MGGFNADRISNRIILERYSIARAENYQLQVPLVQIHFLPLSIRTDDGLIASSERNTVRFGRFALSSSR